MMQPVAPPREQIGKGYFWRAVMQVPAFSQQRVLHSVCLTVTLVNCVRTAEPVDVGTLRKTLRKLTGLG